MNGNGSTSERALGRVEARVADLSEQISSLRAEIARLSHVVETTTSAHHERITALESFRRWAVGLLTGIVLSGVAAVFGYMTRM